jgi:hypothetical protein
MSLARLLVLVALAAATATGHALAGSGSGGGGSAPAPAPSSLAIDPDPLPNGTLGVAYTAFLWSNGGRGTPYEYRVVAGKLPSGLSMTKSFGVQSAAITGAPQVLGTFAFTVEVRDKSGNTARASFSIAVDPATAVSIAEPSDVLNPGTVGLDYVHNLFVSGGASPYAWSVAAGQLPPGLLLSANGSITGTPTTAGAFVFTARVADRFGSTAARAFTIVVS